MKREYVKKKIYDILHIWHVAKRLDGRAVYKSSAGIVDMLLASRFALSPRAVRSPVMPAIPLFMSARRFARRPCKQCAVRQQQSRPCVSATSSYDATKMPVQKANNACFIYGVPRAVAHVFLLPGTTPALQFARG